MKVAQQSRFSRAFYCSLSKILHNNHRLFGYSSSSLPVGIRTFSPSRFLRPRACSQQSIFLERQVKFSIRDTAQYLVVLSWEYNFSMASERNSALASRDPTADGADHAELSVTRGLGPFLTAAQVKRPAPTSKNATADDTDDEDLALSITRGLRSSHRSKRSKNSGLTPPVAVLLTKHTSDHKPSKRYRQEKMRLLELPLDVLCLVADHLDVVACACLEYANPALGYWSKKDPGNLSACARSRIVSLLQRDGGSIPKKLLGVARKGTNEGECSGYQGVSPKYCLICRCQGHLSHCGECGIRTCAREDTEFWSKWTG